MWNLMNPNAADQLREAKLKAEQLQQEARIYALLRQARQLPRLRVSAYVFVSCVRPKAILRNLRRLPGVVKADALAGSSEAIVVVEEESREGLEALLSRIRDLPGVLAANSKLAA